MSAMKIARWGSNVSFNYGDSPSGVGVAISGLACFEPTADGAGACARMCFVAKVTAHNAEMESIYASSAEPRELRHWPTDEGFQMDDPRVFTWIQRGLDPGLQLFRSDRSWREKISQQAPMLAAQYQKQLISESLSEARSASRPQAL